MNRPAPPRLSAPIVQKVVRSLLVSTLVLFLTSLANQDLIEGLLLSVLVGGIVLLIEFLSDVQNAVSAFDERQRNSIEAVTRSQSEGLANFSEATRTYHQMQLSPLKLSQVQLLLHEIGRVRTDTHPLLVDLINLEIRGLGVFLKQLHDSGEYADPAQAGVERPFSIAYYGEDRDWLLGLTSVARKSLDAISLSTIDAGKKNYDSGLWRSDLGHRYLEQQRMAVLRGVTIRRIFYFDNPSIPMDEVFQDVCARQKAIGVKVRILQDSQVPEDLKDLVTDFIVFDDSLGYEMTSAVPLATGRRPEMVTTYLSQEERVYDLRSRFDRLWEKAEEWRPAPRRTDVGPPEP